MSGEECLVAIKEKYNLQLELGEQNVVLAVLSIGDTKDNIDKLYEVFKDFVSKLNLVDKKNTANHFIEPNVILSPSDAFNKEGELIEVENSLGKVCAASVMVYPPGIPVVIPGEEITEDVLDFINEFTLHNGFLIGLVNDGDKEYIRCVVDS